MSLILMNPRHRRSPKNLTLNDVFPEWYDSGGIFSALDDSDAVPWEGVESSGLDIAYHGEKSGSKFISPLLYNFIDTDGEITTAGKEAVSSAIKARYYQKWNHLWGVYSTQYNPLDTYNLTETNERDLTRGEDESGSMVHGHVITDGGTDTTTTTHGHVVTDTGDPTSDTTDQVMGFNSSEFVDKQKTSVESHTDNVETHSGSDTNALLHGKTETNSGTDTTSSEIDETVHEEFSSTKQGTMYRAPAELLSLDRDFWLRDFFSIVFEDVDNMLTLAIYSERDTQTKVF